MFCWYGLKRSITMTAYTIYKTLKRYSKLSSLLHWATESQSTHYSCNLEQQKRWVQTTPQNYNRRAETKYDSSFYLPVTNVFCYECVGSFYCIIFGFSHRKDHLTIFSLYVWIIVVVMMKIIVGLKYIMSARVFFSSKFCRKISSKSVVPLYIVEQCHATLAYI